MAIVKQNERRKVRTGFTNGKLGWRGVKHHRKRVLPPGLNQLRSQVLSAFTDRFTSDIVQPDQQCGIKIGKIGKFVRLLLIGKV